jgi:hypothetical protein
MYLQMRCDQTSELTSYDDQTTGICKLTYFFQECNIYLSTAFRYLQ